MAGQFQQSLVFPAFIPPITSPSNTSHILKSSGIASLEGTDVEPRPTQIAFDTVHLHLNDNFLQFQLPDGFATQTHIVETEDSFVLRQESAELKTSNPRKRYTHHWDYLIIRRRKNVKPPEGNNRFGRRGTLACEQCRSRNSKVNNCSLDHSDLCIVCLQLWVVALRLLSFPKDQVCMCKSSRKKDRGSTFSVTTNPNCSWCRHYCRRGLAVDVCLF